jgi:hypothetical protein
LPNSVENPIEGDDEKCKDKSVLAFWDRLKWNEDLFGVTAR